MAEQTIFKINIRFEGNESDLHKIDLYDVAESIKGLSRTLALVSHLIVHNESIENISSLKDIDILAMPPEEGSWRMTIVVSATATLAYFASLPKDTPAGHLAWSLYPYVIKKTSGQTLDYNKPLQDHFLEDDEKKNMIEEVIDNCRNPTKMIHKPVPNSKTATKIIISQADDPENTLKLDAKTYEFFRDVRKPDEKIEVWISRYNVETLRGRYRIDGEKSTIPFVLLKSANNEKMTSLISKNLRDYGYSRHDSDNRTFKKIKFNGYRIVGGGTDKTLVFKVESVSSS